MRVFEIVSTPGRGRAAGGRRPPAPARACQSQHRRRHARGVSPCRGIAGDMDAARPPIDPAVVMHRGIDDLLVAGTTSLTGGEGPGPASAPSPMADAPARPPPAQGDDPARPADPEQARRRGTSSRSSSTTRSRCTRWSASTAPSTWTSSGNLSPCAGVIGHTAAQVHQWHAGLRRPVRVELGKRTRSPWRPAPSFGWQPEEHAVRGTAIR